MTLGNLDACSAAIPCSLHKQKNFFRLEKELPLKVDLSALGALGLYAKNKRVSFNKALFEESKPSMLKLHFVRLSMSEKSHTSSPYLDLSFPFRSIETTQSSGGGQLGGRKHFVENCTNGLSFLNDK
jgi:hypothetical protein